MITAIEIENFLCFGKRVRIPIRPITVLWGPSNSGKSAAIKALLYAYEIFVNRNPDPDRSTLGGEVVDLGGFANFVHKREKNRTIRLRVECRLTESLPQYASRITEWGHSILDDVHRRLGEDAKQCAVTVEIGWASEFGRAVVQCYRVDLDGIPVGAILRDVGGKAYLEKMNLRHPLLTHKKSTIRSVFEGSFLISKELRSAITKKRESKFVINSLFTAIMSHIWSNERTPPAKYHLYGDSVLPEWGEPIAFDAFDARELNSTNSEHYENARESFRVVCLLFSKALVGPGEAIRNDLAAFRYLGAHRVSGRSRGSPANLLAEGWATGVAAWGVLESTRETFIRQANRWLSDIHGRDSEVEIRLREYALVPEEVASLLGSSGALEKEQRSDAIRRLVQAPTTRRISLVDRNGGVEIRPQDTGTSLCSAIPVVVAALETDVNLTAIEHPDLLLPSAAHENLARLFLHAAQGGRRVFLVETHSPELRSTLELEGSRSASGEEAVVKILEFRRSRGGTFIRKETGVNFE